MSNYSDKDEEMIQLSLGSLSNAVTAHLVNLQGLACTATDHLCNPSMTHESTSKSSYWVPRVLFVEDDDPSPNIFFTEKEEESGQYQLTPTHYSTDNTGRMTTTTIKEDVSSWNGSVDVIVSTQSSSSSYHHSSNNSNNNDNTHQLNEYQTNVSNLLDTSSNHSRYYNPHSNQQYTSSFNQQQDGNRHFNWDDLNEEEEDEDEKERRRYQQNIQYQQQQQAVVSQMNQTWKEIMTVNNNSSKDNKQQTISYKDYWMPPYPSSSIHHSVVKNHEYSHQQISEHLRKLLEKCDYCKGFQVLSDVIPTTKNNNNISILQELQDECPSAINYSTLLHSNQPSTNTNKYWRAESKVIQQFRSFLHTGLTYHGIIEHSDLVLPLSLSTKDDDDFELFKSSAQIAMAIEASTLPFRIYNGNNNNNYCMGIQSGFFQGSGQLSEQQNYSNAQTLSIHEFVSCLRCPSNRHTLLDMSASLPPPLNGSNNVLVDNDDTTMNESKKAGTTSNKNQLLLLETLMTSMNIPTTATNMMMKIDPLYQKLLPGTSIERLQLEQERQQNHRRRNRYPQNIDPGLWLEDTSNGGILTTISPTATRSSNNASHYNDRSLHRHFSMATSIRPSSSSPIIRDYTTMMMEGMGIKCRPEVCLGTVVNQSLQKLTENTWVGSYWNNLMSSGDVVTTLSNSTKSYFQIHQTSTNLKDALSKKYRGYMSRDIMANIVPEYDDCTEALEHLQTLSDIYEPPNGTGFGSDHEGSYFDDDED